MGDHLAGLGHQLAGQRVDDGARQLLVGNSAGQIQLLIIFIAAHAGKVVASRVKEQPVDVRLRTFDGGRLTGAQLAVYLKQSLFGVFAGVFFNGGQNAVVLAEILADLLVGGEAERTDKHRDRNFAVLIDAHVERIVLILQPGAAVRNHRGAEQLLAGLVVIHFIVNAGRTHELRYNDALRTVNHKSTAVCHQREVTHENLGFLDLAGFLIQQAGCYPKSRSVSGIAFLAFLYAVIGLVIQFVVYKIQYQISGIVRDAGNIAENLFQALFQKPLVGILLHLDQVRHVQDFINPGEAHASILA